MLLLVMWFTQDLNESEKIYFNETFYIFLFQCEGVVQHLITPLRRVAVMKSLILCKLLYSWILLPDPSDDGVSNLQNMYF